jgi:hypothetical protein
MPCVSQMLSPVTSRLRNIHSNRSLLTEYEANTLATRPMTRVTCQWPRSAPDHAHRMIA